jgi:hypothetical protein
LDIYQKVNDAVSNLVLNIDPHGQHQTAESSIAVIGKIGACLGLPEAEIRRIAKSMYEVLGEYQRSAPYMTGNVGKSDAIETIAEIGILVA